jgi:hypothetical protein
MDNPATWWRGLSAPWKAFFITFVGALFLFGFGGALFASPVAAIINALLFGGIVAGMVRLYTRMRMPPR